jgi:formylglycine-generating enzyme required for sulfatase activity
MKTVTLVAFFTLGFVSGRADQARFFRVVGPVPTTITGFTADGFITWTNAPVDTTFSVQTAIALDAPANWVDFVQVPSTNPTTTHRLFDPNSPSGMTLIPAGTFLMGDSVDPSGDAPTNTAYISAFYVEKNPVTLAFWNQIYAWSLTNGYGFDNTGSAKTVDCPVGWVFWYDAVKWCNARSQMDGLAPVYYIDSQMTQVYMTNRVPPFANWAANGYRLPTEAEWEKAARGGLVGKRFPWGNTISQTLANYYADTNRNSYDLGPTGWNTGFTNGGYPYASPVSSFPPNGYGLYDMAGNSDEWCWDWYSPTGYSGGIDPHGPDGPLWWRIRRGGNWMYYAEFARAANRDYTVPSTACTWTAFRCVRSYQ